MLTDYQNLIEVWYRYFSLFMKAYGGRLEVFCRLGFNANCYSSVHLITNCQKYLRRKVAWPIIYAMDWESWFLTCNIDYDMCLLRKEIYIIVLIITQNWKDSHICFQSFIISFLVFLCVKISNHTFMCNIFHIHCNILILVVVLLLKGAARHPLSLDLRVMNERLLLNFVSLTWGVWQGIFFLVS